MQHQKALELAEAHQLQLIEKMIVDGLNCDEIKAIVETAYKAKCQYAQNDEQLKKALGVGNDNH